MAPRAVPRRLGCGRAPRRPTARRAVRARLRRLREHAAGSADPAQHPGERGRRAVPRLLARRQLSRPRRERSDARPGWRVRARLRRLHRRRSIELRAAAAGGHLAGQQLRARRQHPAASHRDSRCARGLDAGWAHDRDPHRRRGGGHLRRQSGAGSRRRAKPSCRSTRWALRRQPLPAACPTPASTGSRCPCRPPRRCTR